MGFSGGGSNILKPHTHNGLTVLDGGSLNFNNITQSQSTAGMVFYSDGTHLQQLAYPGVPAGETLTAVAASTAPSWAAAGAGAWTLEGSDTQTNVANLNVNVSDKDVYQIMYNVGNNTVSGFDLGMTINNIGGTGYDTGVWYVNNSAAGSGVASIGQPQAVLSVGGSNKSHTGTVYVFKSQTNSGHVSGTTYRGSELTSASTHGFDYCIMNGGTLIGLTTAVTSLQMKLTSSINVSGSMVVTSMDY